MKRRRTSQLSGQHKLKHRASRVFARKAVAITAISHKLLS
jgi:hypothetical protein